MKTKRLMALVLAGLMIFSVPACGKAKDLKDALDSAKETTSAVEKSDNSDSAADTEGADNADADNADQDAADSADDAGSVIDLGGETLIDNEWCTITAKSLELTDDYYGIVMKVTIENKSDADYTVTAYTAALNGLETNPYTSQIVAAGKKANMEIDWYDTDLEDIDKDSITDYALEFGAYDADYEDVFKETVHVYPYGEDKAAVYERTAEDTDEILVDTDDVQVVCVGIIDDEFSGQTVKYYIKNKTDKKLYVTAENVSVNGFMMDPYWGCEVGANHSVYSTMYWTKDDFEENDITSIETMDLTLEVRDDDTYDEIYSETMTLELK